MSKSFVLKQKYWALAAAAMLVGLDQLFKWLVILYIKPLPGRTLPLISGVFHLTYVENDSMVFGFLGGLSDEGKGILMVVLSLLTAAAVALMIVLLLLEKIKNPFWVWPIAMIIGGGIGNLIDRVFRVSAESGLHCVIDYLDVRIINFAIFNFADCCVVIGTFWILIYILFFEYRDKPSDKPASALPEEASPKEPKSDA